MCHSEILTYLYKLSRVSWMNSIVTSRRRYQKWWIVGVGINVCIICSYSMFAKERARRVSFEKAHTQSPTSASRNESSYCDKASTFGEIANRQCRDCHTRPSSSLRREEYGSASCPKVERHNEWPQTDPAASCTCCP
jgi:hypothetical protein